MKYLLASCVAMLVIVMATGSTAGTWAPDPGQYCLAHNNCLLQTPVPDVNTSNELNRYINNLPDENRPKPGDTITICGATSCTTYTYTNDGKFNGGVNQPRQNHAGGGGSSEGGGGNPPGGSRGPGEGAPPPPGGWGFQCFKGGVPISCLTG